MQITKTFGIHYEKRRIRKFSSRRHIKGKKNKGNQRGTYLKILCKMVDKYHKEKVLLIATKKQKNVERYEEMVHRDSMLRIFIKNK